VTLRYACRDQEMMGAFFLDVRNRLLAERELYRGTLNRTVAEPREVLKALLRGAAGVVLFHNHPSGDPRPSSEDVMFTRRMARAGGHEAGRPLLRGDPCTCSGPRMASGSTPSG
jgi:DNA repair protein RadC